MDVKDIKLEDVASVYSGQNHKCCCGCSGTYSYASTHTAFSSKNRGYAVGPDEVNDKTVKRIFNKLKRFTGEIEVLSNSTQFCFVVGDDKEIPRYKRRRFLGMTKAPGRLYMVMLAKEE